MEKSVENAMIENLFTNTGTTLHQWIEIVKQKNFNKHMEGVNFLKTEYSLGHGIADLIVHKSKGTDSGSAEDLHLLIEKQYASKEHFKPIYEKITVLVYSFGGDIEIAPKNAYVSLRRRKQFATLQPASKKRFEICLIIKGQEPMGILEAITTPNAMCTHKIKLESKEDLTPEVLNWLKKAYLDAA